MQQGDCKQTQAMAEAVIKAASAEVRANVGFLPNGDRFDYANALLAVPQGSRVLPLEAMTPWGVPARLGTMYEPSRPSPYVMFTQVFAMQDGSLGNAANGTLYVKRNENYKYERVIEADTLEAFIAQAAPKLQSKALIFKDERERMAKVRRDIKREKVRNWVIGIVAISAVVGVLALMFGG